MARLTRAKAQSAPAGDMPAVADEPALDTAQADEAAADAGDADGVGEMPAVADEPALDTAQADEAAADAGDADGVGEMPPVDDDESRDDEGEDDRGGFEMAGRTLIVRSVSARGRWRGGIAFGPQPLAIAVGDLTEDQLAAILGDSDHLIVKLDD